MILTTVNFNKINLLVGKFLKILTNRISGLRLGDFQGRERDQYSLHKLYKLVKSSLFLFWSRTPHPPSRQVLKLSM